MQICSAPPQVTRCGWQIQNCLSRSKKT
ncbi:UNVERIFIED_CONTAM: hypothetical protein GTU68_055142 [Idotea baltica]|nr:hypothetical protein [Idotea baltica]